MISEPRITEPRIIQLEDKCCGCGACAAICPVDALEMTVNACGFEYPNFSSDVCISCGRCDATCPSLNRHHDDNVMSAYWAYARDAQILNQSSSGGVFGLLAQDCLNNGGVVYGASFVDNYHRVEHIRVDSLQHLNDILRSKYLQSRIPKDIFLNIKDDLKLGRVVLFSGTACEVAALKNYLIKMRVPQNRLTCIDVFCHGTPSPKLWNAWINLRERCFGDKVSSVNMRDKITGWQAYSVRYSFDNSEVIVPSSTDWYMRAFLSNLSIRPSCSHCPSKFSCESDLSLGDYWGIEDSHPDVSVTGGISAVIIKTENGDSAFSSVKDKLITGQSAFESVLSGNPVLTTSVRLNNRHDEFMSDLANDLPMSHMVKKWTFEPSVLKRIAGLFRSGLYAAADRFGTHK